MAATRVPQKYGSLQTLMNGMPMMPHMAKGKDKPRKKGKKLKDHMMAK